MRLRHRLHVRGIIIAILLPRFSDSACFRERKGTIAGWTSVAQQGKPAGMISS